MAKDPETRFRSMDEVLAALKRVGGAALTATVSGVGATGEYRAMGISGGYGSDSGPNKPGTSSGPHSAISGSGAIPAPLTDSGANELGKKGSRGVVVGAILGIAVLAMIVVFASRSRPLPLPVPAPSATAAPKPTVTATVAAPTASAPVAPQFAKLRINTDPQDASVKEDGIEVCSSTPCEITYKNTDADPTKDHKLMFSKPGYRVENRTVRLADSPLNVKLTKAPQYYQPQPPPQQKPPEDKPPGFKDLPY